MEKRKKIINNAKLFIVLSENSDLDEKRENIIDCIENGADVNVRFGDDGNNTPLHVAVLQHEKEVVKILLEHGAIPTIKNDAGKTALDIAKELPDQAIAEILEANEHEENTTTEETPSTACTYVKRPGTANIRGQLFETKLLTTIYLRALTCKQITQFYLGTNVDGIGDMDDVCMRFKTINADCVIFLQAKHKQDIENYKLGLQDLWQPSGDYSLLKYFNGYKKLRGIFNSSSDVLCRGNYDEVQPYYVMYTTLKDDIECSRKKIVADNVVTDLLRTGDKRNIFQLAHEEDNVDSLTRELMVDDIKNMGKYIFKLIQTNECDDNMLIHEHIRSYHVVLAQKVINVTEVTPEGCRVGTFRKEFFSSTEELLIILRKTLYAEAIISSNLSTTEINDSLKRIISDPSTETISELIGNVLEYDSKTKTLKLTTKIINSGVNFQHVHELSEVKIPKTVVEKAYKIAGRKKLESLKFKLPVAFGNVDMTIIKNKMEKRLQHLANKLCDVIEETADTEGNVVLREGMYAADKCLDSSVLAINGGLAGAVGNLFVSDDNNKLKFNPDEEALGENAKKLFVKLKGRLGDLQHYRFIIERDIFPRLSLQATEQEKRLARNFLGNLYFFTCQAKEDELEKIVTSEPHARECSGLRGLGNRIKSNAFFLKIHKEIQSWWMIEPNAYYLTRNMSTFNKLFREMSNNGLLAFLNFIYLNKIQNTGLEFNSKAIDFLRRSDATSAKMIVVSTDAHNLTGHKLVQYFQCSGDITFLDIDYVWQDSPNLLTEITAELGHTDISVLVIICEDASKYDMNEILRVCKAEKIILVTSTYELSGEYLRLRDENINLSDLTDPSQNKVLENCFVYQGAKVKFDEVFDVVTKYLINAKILQKIMDNETITLGQPLEMSTHHETKHYYVPRALRLNRKHIADDTGREPDNQSSSSNKESLLKFSPTTLIDQHPTLKIKENRDIILILDAPGMGKSTLLTHLSLETKQRNPDIWIQKINLIDYSSQFDHWQKKKVQVDSIEALKFVCNVVLTKEASRHSVRFIDRNIDLEIVNDEVKLVNYNEKDALVAFELNTFLHCFNHRRIVFLFDGFDEICPHYEVEVTQLLIFLTRLCTVHHSTAKCGQKRHVRRVWITSRAYNELKDTLETEFGESYTLQPFDHRDIREFVHKYMQRNFNLTELNPRQLKNINGFFEYMNLFHLADYTSLPEFKGVNIPLHSIYVAAIEYFKSEVMPSYVTAVPIDVSSWWRYLSSNTGANETITLSSVPLHIYIVINYFHHQIKHDTESCAEDLKGQWDLNINTLGFYERFIEVKLKTRLQNKIQMDLNIPDAKKIYEREKEDFMNKHKKLAFSALRSKTPLTDVELNDLKKILTEMETAEDKTGLVDRIVDGKPIFVHYTFTEYFAVEYIVDVLISGDPDQQKRMMNYVLWDMVFLASLGISEIFDLKLKLYPEFAAALRSPLIMSFVWKQLIDQRQGSISEYPIKNTTALDKVTSQRLFDFTDLLVDSITNTIDESCFNDFVTFVKDTLFVNEIIRYWASFNVEASEFNAKRCEVYRPTLIKCEDIVGKILDCIKKFDYMKINEIFHECFENYARTGKKYNDEFFEDCKKCREFVNSNNYSMWLKHRYCFMSLTSFLADLENNYI